MTRLAEIEAHLNSMGELLDIVGAMRSLASMRMQEAQRSLPSVRRYADSVAAAIADTLLLTGLREPPTGRSKALIICMAEHGFVGGFNERLFEVAQETLGPKDLLFVLGSRGAALASERDLPAVWNHPMATRCAGAPDTVQHLSDELYRRIAVGEIARVDILYARYRQGASAEIERRLLLPLDASLVDIKRPGQAPLHNLDPIILQEKLIAEYVFALLTEAVVESIASENAARLAAMESAHGNVDRKLAALKQDAREARQSEITAEILELVAAEMALDAER